MTENITAYDTSCWLNSLEYNMVDWVIMGNQDFRSSEWYQPHYNKSIPINAPITRNIDNSATTFIASDFELRDKRKRPLNFSLKLESNLVDFCDTQ